MQKGRKEKVKGQGAFEYRETEAGGEGGTQRIYVGLY